MLAAGLSGYHLSYSRRVGCAPFKPSAVTIFLEPLCFISAQDLVRTFREVKTPLSAFCLEISCSVRLSPLIAFAPLRPTSVDAHQAFPSWLRWARGRGSWGGKSFLYFCMTVLATVQPILILGKVVRVGGVYSCFILLVSWTDYHHKWFASWHMKEE